VYRVGAAYLAVVFAGLQGADLIFPALGLGPRGFNVLVLVSLLGFPVALALAWTFDVTGGTIRRTASVDAAGVTADPDRWVRLKAALVGGGFVAVLFLGIGLWQGPAMDGGGDAILTERPVLAVLPFQDLSPEGDQEYFADGLHEELLHQLATLRGLRLVSRTSVMHFRGSPWQVGAIADSLGADYVLEGSVRRAVDSVRVTVQLIPAEADEHLWSESYTRALSMDGLFDLQRTLAMRLARSLGGTLATGHAERLGSAPTRSLDAYNAFLRGLHHWNTMTREGFEAAEDDFRQAIRLDPEFGQAHAMLAMTHVMQNNSGVRRRGELFPLIREHAAMAMRYAPDQAESHMAQASVHYTLEWDWEAARRELEAAVALDQRREDWTWALAEWHGIVAGDTERALEIVDDALRLNPFAATAGVLRASVLHFGRRYAEAAEEYRKLRAVDPANPTNTMNLVSNLALSG
jgi:adenylate cyclase